MKTNILTISCRDTVGIVADVAAVLKVVGGNIIESAQFFQPDAGTTRGDGLGQFFMRIEFTTPDGGVALDAFAPFAAAYDAVVELVERERTLRVIVMVSKFDHCLQDILYRCQTGTLPIEIAAVVSNHPDTRPTVERLGIPFHLWPVRPDNKAEQEARLDGLIGETDAELIVLARYMQILSDGFSSRHFGRIINIHHSFLPAFKGAKPYHRAWDRGVKHIGATAHYVTPDLDEGPIIEQDTERVSHTSDADDLVRRGRDIEARVLSRAIRLHAERRVFINGTRTVVFD